MWLPRRVGFIQYQKRAPPASWVWREYKIYAIQPWWLFPVTLGCGPLPRWRSPYEAIKTWARPHEAPWPSWIFSGVSQPIWVLSSPSIKEEWKVGSSELQPVLWGLPEDREPCSRWCFHPHSFIRQVRVLNHSFYVEIHMGQNAQRHPKKKVNWWNFLSNLCPLSEWLSWMYLVQDLSWDCSQATSLGYIIGRLDWAGGHV